MSNDLSGAENTKLPDGPSEIGRTLRKRLCLIFLVSENFDCAAIFEQALRKDGLEFDVIKIPSFFITALTVKRLNALRKLLKEKSQTHVVIFSPNTTEFFPEEADYLLVFSAYRSWFRPEKMRVIPHLWTPMEAPNGTSDLKWNSKPPLRIGFMGRSHSTSRLANFALKLPRWMKAWCLRADYLRFPMIAAFSNELGFPIIHVNSFARIEILRVLYANNHEEDGVELDIVERESFNATPSEISEYKAHMLRSTYIVCPRGTENYSFRIYEALNLGRIPVIIDTDTVLPDFIDWKDLAIIVPYSKLNQVYEIILNDFRSRSGQEFVRRQEKAMSTMSNLRNLHWVREITASFRLREALRSDDLRPGE